MHLVKRVLDSVESDAFGHELLQRQPTLQVEADQGGEVTLGQTIAVPRRLQRAAAGEEVKSVWHTPHAITSGESKPQRAMKRLSAQCNSMRELPAEPTYSAASSTTTGRTCSNTKSDVSSPIRSAAQAR